MVNSIFSAEQMNSVFGRNVIASISESNIVHAGFQYLAQFEIGDFRGRDLDLFPGPGIPALSRRPLTDAENAEISEFDRVPVHDRLDKQVDYDPRVFSPDSRKLPDQSLEKFRSVTDIPFPLH